MPTSNFEAEAIVRLASRYLTKGQQSELFRQLHEQVGAKTENFSLQESLAMLHHLTAQPAQPSAQPQRWLALVAFIATCHLLVVLGNVCAFFLLPFLVPWYVALPCCSAIIYLGLTHSGECPLTTWENSARVKAGLPLVHGFLGHYLIRPVRRWWRGPRKLPVLYQPEDIAS